MISTLVHTKEKPIKSAKTLRAIVQVGHAVNVAVERFVSVGEAIADDSPEIKTDMYGACKDARSAGAAIQQLTEVQYDKSGQLVGACTDKNSMVRAARSLLSSVTRVLLLADTVVVKQLLSAKDKVAISLNRLENVANFTEFVKAFSQFGTEMVELAHLTGDRQNDLKDEKRRAQMFSARQILERSTMMLLTASKTCLRHPDSDTSRENRDTVFCQMRRAMDMIHFVVKDGVIPDLAPAGDDRYNGKRNRNRSSATSARAFDDLENNFTVHNTIKKFENIVEMTRMTLVGPSYRERLTSALDSVVECTQDFTDSAYTSHEHREKILLLCDRAKLELNQLLRIGISMDQTEITSPGDELEMAIVQLLSATQDLRRQLQITALDQAVDVRQFCYEQNVLHAIRNSALAGDTDRIEEYSERFHEQAEHLHEVCKLLWHISHGETLQVTSKHTETSIRVYGPQMICAAHTVSMYPNSKIAKENLDVFIDVWTSLVKDVNSMLHEITEFHEGRLSEKPLYMSLPRPGKHGTTTKQMNPVKLDCEEQAKIAKLGLEMKLLTSEIDAETEKWEETENNDIVKRAKNMSAMAFSMYQFTRGEGLLKTTQDLFTQAEYFAEQANKLYKLVRQFSYQVPGSPLKKELLELLDKVPTYVQQLQFTVKNPTVGKAATFTKVDNVIQETKKLMNVISKVVTTCFVCATKYNLDFQVVTGGSSGRSSQNNLSPMRMDSVDDTLTDGTTTTINSTAGGSLNKPSNGQSGAPDTNI
ncbi:CTNNAL1 (predicted) [Pycnogonum litorale]